ncbi:DUF1015 domain-containing protein [Spirochaetia bacterium 38H-sp]|uniref:DUF1015 domain-containing protein n=1 Tax=Rarispira pelagica TaxID=3141764 RepID=A0ABU9UC87_9SPIR
MNVVIPKVLKTCKIMLPSKKADIAKWPVIACDQFTSQRSYWESLADQIGDAPSTLKLILPEVYLEDTDVSGRIDEIHKNMHAFLEQGLMEELPEGAVITERTTVYGRKRTGLIIAADLEAYSYTDTKNAAILPTEATVPERIPPRLEVRRGAVLELPHVMLLVDDKDNRFMQTIKTLQKREVYDTKLLKEGGHVRGWFIEKDFIAPLLEDFLRGLANEHDGIVAAVGDGNHSLATAKALWEEKKNSGVKDGHPARYSLVEVVSIHDPGLAFEPIHRLVFDCNADTTMDMLSDVTADSQVLNTKLTDNMQIQQDEIIISDGKKTYKVKLNQDRLAVEQVQYELDKHNNIKMDYTHGYLHTMELTETGKNTAIFLPAIPREEVFATIQKRKVFPRKSFSLGEAEEKRYYLEARRIE